MTHRHTVPSLYWLRFALALGVILVAGGCGSAGHARQPLARKHSWEVSFNQGDAAAVAALYAPDAELVMSGEPPVRGRAAIRAAIDKMIHSGVKVRIDTDQAVATGDVAYFYGSYEVSSNQKVVERGAYLEVWRRHRRQWLIELDVNATGAPIVSGLQH